MGNHRRPTIEGPHGQDQVHLCINASHIKKTRAIHHPVEHVAVHVSESRQVLVTQGTACEIVFWGAEDKHQAVPVARRVWQTTDNRNGFGFDLCRISCKDQNMSFENVEKCDAPLQPPRTGFNVKRSDRNHGTPPCPGSGKSL